jgi:hypothetical protein
MEEGKLSMTTLEESNLEVQKLFFQHSEEIEKLVTEAIELKHMNEYLEVHDMLTTLRQSINELIKRIMQIYNGVRTKKQVGLKP